MNKLRNCIGKTLSILTLAGLVGLVSATKEKKPYYVTQAKGFNQGDTSIVETIGDTYKDADLWRVITHYYDPQIVREVGFENGSEVIVEYPLLRTDFITSGLKRQTPGPKPGEKYTLEGKFLKKVD